MATSKDVAEANRMRAAGWRVQDIADHFGVTRKTITNWTCPESAELNRKRNREWKSKNPGRERTRRKMHRRQNRRYCPSCSQLMGLGSQGKQCKRCMHEEWEWELRDIQRLWEEGVPAKEIAEKHGVKVRSLYGRIKRARASGWEFTNRSPGTGRGSGSRPEE